jgi:hypothetical protein
MKYTLLVLSVCLILISFSCKSEPPPEPIIIIEDPLVLQELNPLLRSIVPVYVAEYEPVYAVFRIIEVSEVDGVQRYFLARLGADRTGIEVGLSESIAEDEAFSKIIGKYQIVDISGNFFQCEILELDYKIGTTAYIRVKVGEKLKEKEA